MTEENLLTQISSIADNQNSNNVQPEQIANSPEQVTQPQAEQLVHPSGNPANIKQMALRDLSIIKNLTKAGILNPIQGQHLANYILNKATEVLVKQPKTQPALQVQLPKTGGIEEFVKAQPDFFKQNARSQVLDYLKNSNTDFDLDGITQISKLIEAIENSAISGYLQKQAHEKSLNSENETAKLRLKANAQNQNSAEHTRRIFTREQIGKMSGAEFAKNEQAIMEQLRKGLIR